MIRVRVNTRDIERIIRRRVEQLRREPLTATQRTQLGNSVVKLMKDNIKKGISPISGRRFPAYKRAGEPDGYPDNIRYLYPSKRARPVNLFLSGDFLSDLSSRATKNGFSIGFSSNLSRDKESGHRDGVNGQPKRPIIPDFKGGENFSERIREAISTLVEKLINIRARKELGR